MTTNPFTPERLASLFPPERTDMFFDALFGGAEEGAYTIILALGGEKDNGDLLFYFELHQRPGRCLVCSLTYGLPQVFERHPVLNIKQVARDLAQEAGWNPDLATWTLGATESVSNSLHKIPLTLKKGRHDA